MAGVPKSYPIVAKCKRCGNLLGTFSGDESARSTVKCGKCGTENLLKARAIDEETKIKRDRLFPRKI